MHLFCNQKRLDLSLAPIALAVDFLQPICG